MVEINKFKDYTARKLQEVYEAQDWNRAVFGISCVFHGNQHFGNNSDPQTMLYQVPYMSGNTLGRTLFEFEFEDQREAWIDQVYWPDNLACAN